MLDLALKTTSLFGGAERASSDEALAARVRASGDTAAFAQLVTRYRGRMVTLARRMLLGANPDEAEDIAQEAFAAAYHKRTTFRPGEPFRPWLYRIVVNRCLDRLRTHSRRPVFVTLEQAAEPISADGDPLTAVLADEREVRLTAAVAALPPHHRAVFLLRHLDDLSYTEIGAATGLPPGTVKTHLFRARAQLRQYLAGYLEL